MIFFSGIYKKNGIVCLQTAFGSGRLHSGVSRRGVRSSVCSFKIPEENLFRHEKGPKLIMKSRKKRERESLHLRLGRLWAYWGSSCYKNSNFVFRENSLY